jgi:hypothetical protein
VDILVSKEESRANATIVKAARVQQAVDRLPLRSLVEVSEVFGSTGQVSR